MILVCLGGIIFFSLMFSRLEFKGKKYVVISACTILFLYAALRAHNLQPDIPRYVSSYKQYAGYSFKSILALFKSSKKDPFYYFFGWCFSQVFSSAQWWLAFVALVYLVSVGLLFYKQSENPLLSFTAFLALGFFEFSLSGLRQTIALSLTMLSYFGIKKRNWKMFILLVLVAGLFHKSALIFLISYPLTHLKLGKIHILIAVFVAVMFIVGESYIRSFLQNYLVDSQYSGYIDRTERLTMAGFFIQLLMFAFCLFYYPVVSRKYKSADVLYNLAYIGMLFQLFSSMIAEVFRISMYFSFFNILLIPMAITAEKEKRIQLLETIAIGMAFIAYMVTTGIPPYGFFWG